MGITGVHQAEKETTKNNVSDIMVKWECTSGSGKHNRYLCVCVLSEGSRFKEEFRGSSGSSEPEVMESHQRV